VLVTMAAPVAPGDLLEAVHAHLENGRDQTAC
jgi:hypothetical protein